MAGKVGEGIRLRRFGIFGDDDSVGHKQAGHDQRTGDAENEANDKSGDNGEHWFTSLLNPKSALKLKFNGAAIGLLLVKLAVDWCLVKTGGAPFPASAFSFSGSFEW